MLNRRLRFVAFFCCGVFLTSTCAPAISGTLESIRYGLHRLHRQGSGDYTDSPGPVDYGQNPFEDPIQRGYFYSSDDLAAFNISDQVEAGTLTMPAEPDFVTNGTMDTGDDMVLDGRPAPVPRDVSPGPGGFMAPFDQSELWAMINPATASSSTSAVRETVRSGSASLTTLLASLATTSSAVRAIAKGQGSGGDVNAGARLTYRTELGHGNREHDQ